MLEFRQLTQSIRVALPQVGAYQVVTCLKDSACPQPLVMHRTPTSAGGPVSVTIEATNSAGSDTETISITVKRLPDIDYTGSPYSFTKGNPISTITPTNSGGIASSWSITSGSMPSGLAFDSSSGEITGTPTVVTNSASVTILASNSAGSHSDTISITVNDIAPEIIALIVIDAKFTS